MSNKPILDMRGISKYFPGVTALDSVELSLMPGEIHALLGENGAGKSTLMKILSGVYQKDAGEILLHGKSINIANPRHAQEMGISIIHQELNLVPELTVMENMYLGREPVGLVFINEKTMYNKTTEALLQLGSDINPHAKVSSLSIGEQQMVEIAKALTFKSNILIMDEPTTALTDRESERLFAIVRNLTASGVGIIYISHRMEELFALSNRITIMRDGGYVATVKTEEVTFNDLVKMMVGREVTNRFPKEYVTPGDEVLRVEKLTRHGILDNISFTVKAGEVVSLAGLMGSGRTELARAIFGADRIDCGDIYICGEKKVIRRPADAIKAQIGLITEDRKHEGLVLGLPVGDNMSLASLERMSHNGFINNALEAQYVNKHIKNLKVRTSGAQQIVKNLSGGNQQKVVIGKWLLTNPQLLIMDEPTRGIDVGAKAEIYHIMNMLTANGVAILMISSELPEVLGMSDRILVMHQGRITAEMSVTEATQEKIMAYAAGGA